MIILRKMAPLALLAAGLAACAAGSEASQHAAQSGTVAQILLGFWHGLIAPFTLIGEIINQLAPHALPWTFRFYETQHTGVLYDVGFLISLLAGPSILWTGRRRMTLNLAGR
jgi:hypothetical protein